MLVAGPLAERPRFDPKTAARGGSKSVGDGEEARSSNAKLTPKSNPGDPLRAVARDATDPATALAYADSAAALDELLSKVKAPWELDGRKWHTGGRAASNGRPTRWDGRLLDSIVSQIEALAGSDSRLLPADWSGRNVVRIISTDHAVIQFPFFHATTSSEWVVTMRFFVPKNTFGPRVLDDQLGLVPFHQSSPPVLCDQPRVKTTINGPFQVITIVGYSLEEFQTPTFDAFLRKAVAAFLNIGNTSKIKKASELG